MSGSELEVFKPYHQMDRDEKRNWRSLNRKRFVGRGFAGVSAGSGMMTLGVTFAKGYSLDRILLNVGAVEFILMAALCALYGIFHVLMLAPWED